MACKNSIKTILAQKYQDNSLASLYLLNYNSSEINPEIWANEFLTQLSPIADHPDILKIYKDEKESEYKVDSASIRYFLKFINYRPLKLKKKIIFLFEAHDISQTLANKLLKIFEELNSHFCLFLMVPDNSFMLPTVLSRAIKLQIPHENVLTNSVPDFSKIKSPYDLLALLKEAHAQNGQLEKKFIEHMITRYLNECTSTPDSFNKLDELLKILAVNEIFNNFNNSKLARMTQFFS